MRAREQDVHASLSRPKVFAKRQCTRARQRPVRRTVCTHRHQDLFDGLYGAPPFAALLVAVLILSARFETPIGQLCVGGALCCGGVTREV